MVSNVFYFLKFFRCKNNFFFNCSRLMINLEFFSKTKHYLKKISFWFILSRKIVFFIVPRISVHFVQYFAFNESDFKHIRQKSKVYDARRVILFYSYALVEFWVRAFGCDWLTPDTRPWYRSTASCRRTRCCSPRDASHSSSPSSDAAARGSSQDAC